MHDIVDGAEASRSGLRRLRQRRWPRSLAGLTLVAFATAAGCQRTGSRDCLTTPFAGYDHPQAAVYEAPDEPVDLRAAERKVYSQAGEDGVIERIFEIIEPTEKYAVEFGAADGIGLSNVRHLVLDKGWRSFQIEGDPGKAARLKENYRDVPGTTTLQAWVWPGNVEILFEEAGVPRDFDFLVIDIDSNDYYVWRAIQNFRPKVVMIEANSRFPPPDKMVIEFHPMNYWDGSAYAGASLQSLADLGKRKGYELIYHMSNGVNAFFVDAKYYPLFGLKDNSPTALFRPPYGASPEALRDTPEHLLGKKYLVWKELRIPKVFRLDR